MMKKLLKKFLFVSFLLFLINPPVLFANNVSDIDIEVNINNDGSAIITQKWEGDFSEGTECYFPINVSSNDILDFKVIFNNHNYTFDKYWNINNSFNQKSYHCGINSTQSPIELCFGISQYGHNTYIISYKIKDFIKSYLDYDGFNFMLLSPNMNIYPSKINCIIKLYNNTILNNDNCAMWSFGIRNGDINFENGIVCAKSNNKISNDEHLIVVLALKKQLINPNKKLNVYFADVIQEALESSTYKASYQKKYEALQSNENSFDIIFFIIVAFFLLIIVVGYVVYIIGLIKDYFNKKKFYKNCEYFRDIPNNKNISMTYALLKDFSYKKINETNIFGALILQMIYDKNIEEDIQTKVVFFGKVKNKTNLVLKSQPEEEYKLKLYDIIQKASGNNQILEDNEFSNYAEKHFDKLKSFITDIYNNGRNLLFENHCYKKKSISKRFNDLSDEGLEQLKQAIGLKKYLTDFSLIDEREIKEIDIWDSYLVYATLFGVADKVYKQMSKLYPRDLVDPNEKYTYIQDSYYNSMYLNNLITRNFYRFGNNYYKHLHSYNDIFKNIRRGGGFGSGGGFENLGGFGGSISFGGGGGFSGGGIGGGTR